MSIPRQPLQRAGGLARPQHQSNPGGLNISPGVMYGFQVELPPGEQAQPQQPPLPQAQPSEVPQRGFGRKEGIWGVAGRVRNFFAAAFPYLIFFSTMVLAYKITPLAAASYITLWGSTKLIAFGQGVLFEAILLLWSKSNGHNASYDQNRQLTCILSVINACQALLNPPYAFVNSFALLGMLALKDVFYQVFYFADQRNTNA